MGAVKEGVNGKLYVVEYSENLWMKFDQEGKDFCFATWAKKATPMGCDMVVLRLHPDDFFPLYGNEKPYVAAQVPIEKAAPAIMRSKTKCYVELTDAWNKLPENEKLIERQKARELGQRSGCDAWEVWYGRNTRLDSGYNNQKGQHGVGRG